LDGSELKKYVPSLADCTGNTTYIVNAIRQAALDFTKENMTFVDIADGIKMIGIAVQSISNSTKTCREIPDAFRVIIYYIGNATEDIGRWIRLVKENAWNNSMWITSDVYGIVSAVGSKRFYDVGFKIGEIGKFFLKVDMVQSLQSLYTTQVQVSSSMQINYDKLIQCGKAVLSDAVQATPILTDLYNHPENMMSDLMQLLGIFRNIGTEFNGIFDVFAEQRAMRFKKVIAKSGKIPNIADVIDCLKSIKPLVQDIYYAVTNFTQGHQQQAWDMIEQAGIDLATGGIKCYKVIEEILDNSTSTLY